MTLSTYRALGRPGLLVSPLALGTMTFGTARWGSDEATSRAVFDAYVEAGGNFLDTADIYSGGRSEEMLGVFVAERSLRHRLVIATKSGFSRERDTPLAGGNGARNIRWALESSLRRLRTDHVDLYWTHVWDRLTPPEETLRALTDAVRRGDILHYGFSNAPAWYVTRLATLAEAHGLPAPIGLQYSYSLLDRGVELELVPAGQALGLGMVPWSPLGAGMLTGKYGREMLTQAGPAGTLPDGTGADIAGGAGDGRLHGDNPFGGMLFTERNFAAVDALRDVAADAGWSMAQTALAWVSQRPGVASVLVGARRPQQLADNLAATAVALGPDQLRRLEEASALPSLNPYFIFRLPRERLFGGSAVTPWETRPAP
ncbi:aldo/keto reductase [Rhizosaccharibacter radicis]|uniref:Aldo/keto reductase n=1 Tax=Rhizosaccharibacter radicis TaxID=2782605 RepID=A0ABT1W132_9PROT|nr:aldo/keto reductase [Acetobacteraceae bacterium KSS12]